MAEPTMPGRTVALTIDAVAHCTDFVTSHAQEAGFPIARVREVELVVEEVVANICKYSYGDGLGNVELICRRLDGARLELEFIDYGRPFDILAQPDPDLSVDIDQRDVGGIGVPMLRALINQASYRRDEERNVLMVIVEAKPRLRRGDPEA
jgi:anti-sigma regulatory factor (Ser/Thr protein kinase)